MCVLRLTLTWVRVTSACTCHDTRGVHDHLVRICLVDLVGIFGDEELSFVQVVHEDIWPDFARFFFWRVSTKVALVLRRRIVFGSRLCVVLAFGLSVWHVSVSRSLKLDHCMALKDFVPRYS